MSASGVQEVSTFAVEGLPYLRTTRFLAAMKDRANTDSEAEAWLAEMHRLGIDAKKRNHKASGGVLSYWSHCLIRTGTLKAFSILRES